MTALLLVGSFVVIIIGAALFTNAVEWFGQHLGLAEGAVGSVLAAVGTALPETMIPLVAIVFGVGSRSDAVGIGAILGAPLMLATLAMFVTGLAVLDRVRRRTGEERMSIDPAIVGRDVRTFGVTYAGAIAVAFLPADLAAPRWLAAAALIGAYGWYVRGHLTATAAETSADPRPLRLARVDRAARPGLAQPRLRVVLLQLGLALLAIVAGAVVFVDALETLARSVGLDETLLSLLIAPIATELPEQFNSVIWIRRGRDTLALGNITGAMVFQAAIPTSIALVFASSQWSIASGSWIAFSSAGIALLSTGLIFRPMFGTGRLHGRRLLLGGAMFGAQLGLVVAGLSGALGA